MASEALRTQSSLNSTFPVLVPEDAGVRASHSAFEGHIRQMIESARKSSSKTSNDGDSQRDAEAISNAVASMQVEDEVEHGNANETTHSFMEGLLEMAEKGPAKVDLPSSQMLTDNGDVTFRTTGSVLVDLFQELETVISGGRLLELLEQAWKEDQLATLKIIWNARSIHLGKSDKNTFYRAIGFLYKEHPLTVLFNLPYLFAPVISKKAEAEEDKDIVLVDESDIELEAVDQVWMVRHGVAHGYWKDLLNLAVLAVNDELDARANPKNTLNRKNTQVAGVPFNQTKAEAKERKHKLEAARHSIFMNKFQNDPFYRALHLTVARLFAMQLNADKEHELALESEKVSFAAKWAPSPEKFHDKYTFLASTIAEMLCEYPDTLDERAKSEIHDRESYLRYARVVYQKRYLRHLRKVLNVTEVHIAANRLDKIAYNEVPSLAMNQYGPLFMTKDTKRYQAYLEKVSGGKDRISGAILFPSLMVRQAQQPPKLPQSLQRLSGLRKSMMKQMIQDLHAKKLDGQWESLVQRIKDSGTLQSAIAVVDVSASMQSPTFSDGTTPMATSIGLGLLLAEVVDPPFGGVFITFSETPEVVKAGGKDDTRPFTEKVKAMSQANWGGSTNIQAVFKDLILPMAQKHRVKPEDMVKTVFVFSDMHFNQADRSMARDKSSFERIKRSYRDAGYEMPQMVFWNIAGGHSLQSNVAPKPVVKDQPGAAQVSGYSQAMLKTFLENGQFEGEEKDTTEVRMKDVDEDTVQVRAPREKVVMTPEMIMWKALSHKAYDMLKVYD